MGLLDGYLDPEEFQASGGLLGRLLLLPPMQGLYQPSMGFDHQISMGFDPQISADNGQAVGAWISAAMPPPILRSNGPMVSLQAPLYRSAQNIPAVAFGNGITGLSSGRGTDADGYSDTGSNGNGRDAGSSEAVSIAGAPPPGLSKIGYFQVPTNPNQAFSELWGIQQRNERAAVSRKDYISGVREGNVRYNPDEV